MMRYIGLRQVLLFASFLFLPGLLFGEQKPAIQLAPATMPRLGTVDARFVSYNVEMVSVTGGRFWKPYPAAAGNETRTDTQNHGNHQPGMDPNLYQYLPPINLQNTRLRKLAEALGPAYLRVSGTWQNSTYFQNNGDPAMKQAPRGFQDVLTRAEWKNVIEFARATDDQIVTSVATSPGTRNAAGVWTPNQAKAFFDYTASLGGRIAASEFMNEPTFPSLASAPASYDATAFAKDAKAFKSFLREESPRTIFLGPGGVGEGLSLGPVGRKMLPTEDILKATGPIFDAFSYHSYGAVSHRCGSTTTIDQTLSADWLGRADKIEAFYAGLRDKYMPGKPLWLTETAEAACGADPFAAQFADTFRYVNQLGSLAQKGVKVVMHDTLAASDYGLLSENFFDPRPDYWAALLWNRTMGTGVLNPMAPQQPKLRIYAQCMKGSKGGVTLVALNADKSDPQAVTVPTRGVRYTLTAADLASAKVLLNGVELKAGADGSVPPIVGRKEQAGRLSLPPLSVTFFAMATAHNMSCR